MSAGRPRRLTLIVAAAENGVIGRDNRLPWHLPDDLRRFKRLTLGHPLIMGRRTFESIGGPLPGRRSLVLSRDPGYRPHGVEVYGNLDAALAAVTDADEVFVIGGAALFERALPRADRIQLTRVHGHIDGDVRFPDPDPAHWRLVSAERHEADAEHALPFSFQVWERRHDG